MCGICGLVTVEGPACGELVDGMRATLRHRGPDEHSTDIFGRCGLGHQRLVVLDPRNGYQPVANEAGDVVAVFNGELYNYRELRRDLRGHEIRGTGDAPVIPHLYEEYGTAFVERLHGMFAVALWDERRERLVLARDRLGKKPLLWARLLDGTFAFASELKALLTLPELDRTLDFHALDAYLALQYVPGTATPFREIRKLAPGHLLVLERGRLHVERWWHPNPATEAPHTEQEWLELVRETVSAAVRRRLTADVPIGALLSGGIDSSIVVSQMAQVSPEPIRTFTVGFGDGHYDERRYAREVASRYGTEHSEMLVEPDVLDLLPRLAETLDEPLGDEAALPLYVVCREARRHVKVALVGDGGDESFAGYDRYVAAQLAGFIPRPVAALGARTLGVLRGSRTEPRSSAARAARLLRVAALPAPARYGALMEVIQAPLRTRLWTSAALAELGNPRPAADLLRPSRSGIIGLQLLDLETYLAGDLLPKADLTSMAHSLELRSPFLDHEVVALGLALPDSLRFRGLTGKCALRGAFAADLPESVAARGKTGLGVPLARWFRGELRGLAGDVLLDRHARDRGWFDPQAVEVLLRDHVDGRAEHGHALWVLVMLELWARRWIDVHAPAEVALAFAS